MAKRTKKYDKYATEEVISYLNDDTELYNYICNGGKLQYNTMFDDCFSLPMLYFYALNDHPTFIYAFNKGIPNDINWEEVNWWEVAVAIKKMLEEW